ncbi:MAG: efflux RND transporter periplasmic adaptor subunit [Sulfuricurvum sp.]
MKSITHSVLSVCTATMIILSPLYADAPQKGAASQTQPIPKVDTYKVTFARSLPVEFAYPARLSAFQNATVTSRVTGALMKKLFTEGSFVKKGQFLYKIEPDSYAAIVNEKAADVELKKASLMNAQREWDRVQNLTQNNAISKKEHDAALSAYEIAKADVNSAKARLQSAKIDLDYTSVKAPISGIAGMKLTDVGNVVTAGVPLVTITQVDPLYAEFSIPDVDLRKAGHSLQTLAKSKNLKVSLTYDNQSYIGVIDYIAPQINTATGSIKIRAKLQNPDNVLIPGAFGRIKIVGIQSTAVITVPQKAVLQNKKGTIVMVVENGIVGIRPIQLGKKAGDHFIVAQGLKGGEQVIVNNFFRIKPGVPVAVDKIINDKVK